MDNNNKDKQIKNYEVSDKEINDFFELSKRLKKYIPLLQNASIKEIEEWVFKIISFYLFILLGLPLLSDSLLETQNNINRKFYKQLIYISKCVFLKIIKNYHNYVI
ncbi:hypothetical protein OC686_02060 ['Opuntia sp.' phytoplasma]|uniref:hypothetical protein n=1 Tax=Candidatus Phytoplasma asiaticum TaxID=2763338 RepID=UPI0027127930|nr:hypothetical protein ['Opuntia sp.' phytoplasma]MDO8058044.1 hypothetical protein ['Opuntia sp.' phytoplasma]